MLSKNLPITKIEVHFYGSLALTGKGHGSDLGAFLGLLGHEPHEVEKADIDGFYQAPEETLGLPTFGIQFHTRKNIFWHRRKSLPPHPNGMIFRAFAGTDQVLEKTYFSIGGGFIVSDDEVAKDEIASVVGTKMPFRYNSASELMAMCKQEKLSMAEIVYANERSILAKKEDLTTGLNQIWQAMSQSIEAGLRGEGVLPGSLKVKRRAAGWWERLKQKPKDQADPLESLDWVSLFALAVNEENASFGRVVTAPTNGASGIIPAVLKFGLDFMFKDRDPIALQHEFLLTAGAIGILYLKQASISGAEVGCQGEVGVACSMAAAGLCAISGGSVEQIEEAAEIGMEHNLGLTCDPIGGLVQIPCIERNAMAAVKAINAARIALRGDGQHKVSLDQVIKTMHQTGRDMRKKYKETAQGGLAVNVIEC